MYFGDQAPALMPTRAAPVDWQAAYAQLPPAELAMRLHLRENDYAKLKADFTRAVVAAVAFGALSAVLGVAHMVRR